MTVLKCIQEFFDGTIIKRIHRYDLVVRKNNTDRNGDIKRITVIKGIVLGWGFNNDELYIILQLVTGTFVNIQRVG